jgi:hypothetical protein
LRRPFDHTPRMQFERGNPNHNRTNYS